MHIDVKLLSLFKHLFRSVWIQLTTLGFFRKFFSAFVPIASWYRRDQYSFLLLCVYRGPCVVCILQSLSFSMLLFLYLPRFIALLWTFYFLVSVRPHLFLFAFGFVTLRIICIQCRYISRQISHGNSSGLRRYCFYFVFPQLFNYMSMSSVIQQNWKILSLNDSHTASH